MFRSLVLVLAVSAAPAAAQTVSDCSGGQVSAMSILEPWEEYSRTFSNGTVRVAIVDLIEPAAAAYQLLVMFPPYNEVGERMSCAVLGMGNYGFGRIGIDEIQSSDEAATDLTISVPVSANGYQSALSATINQSEGTITSALGPWIDE
jgi:hypothetical protein